MASKSKCRYGIRQAKKDSRPSLKLTIKEQLESYSSILLQIRNHFKIWRIGSNKSTSHNQNPCARSSQAIKLIVSFAEGKSLAQKYGVQFIECSAKDNYNIGEIFNAIGKPIKKKLIDGQTSKPSQNIKIRNAPNSKQKKSCEC